MNEVQLIKLSLLLLITASVASYIIIRFSKKTGIFCSAIIGIISSALSLYAGALILINKSTHTIQYPSPFAFGSYEFVTDPLSAFFLILISLLNIPILIYSIGYLKSEYMDSNPAFLSALYHLFVLSMILLVLAANSFLFLVFWECMTLVSFVFVIFDLKSEDSQKAGFMYLLMTHIGTAFLLFMILILSKYTGSFSFSSFHNIGEHMPNMQKLILFSFALIAFGTKAGLVPLHTWLPEAHPAAPSHISALMSGVMIKTAVYGILRFLFDFLAPLPYSCGLVIICVAVFTALLGIIYASDETDLKRLLAFSSIENMGIIFIPIGLAIVFLAFGFKEFALLSIIASLLHTVNHSLFKGLLFLSSGSIISAVHTRNIEKMGGLIKFLPHTAFLFLIGSLAISAFPPFNGFISKWLIFQMLLLSFNLPLQEMKIVAPIFAAFLGLVGAVSAFTFVKAFSGIFLAMPRSHQPSHAKEVSAYMRCGIGILSVLCLILGILPFKLISLLTRVGQSITGVTLEPGVIVHNSFSVQYFGKDFALLSPVIVFVVLVLLFLFLYIFMGRNQNIRREETWSCGISPKSEYEYTPSGFSQPLKVVFSEMHVPESFYHKYIYLPIINTVMFLSHRMKSFQSGVLQIYLLYIFITLIVCLVWLKL